MARIKIEDLPVLEELSKKETKGIFGGFYNHFHDESSSFNFECAADQVAPQSTQLDGFRDALQNANRIAPEMDTGERSAEQPDNQKPTK